MTFQELASYFETIEQTASRNEMTELIAKLFSETTPEEIAPVVYMLQGRVAPQYVKSDFGMGEKMVTKAAVKALNVDDALFRNRLKVNGDVGATVQELKHAYVSLLNEDRDVLYVFKQLTRITQTTGDGSQEAKQALLADLIQSSDPLSARYIVRIPTQTLRLGFSDMTVLDALSWMLVGTKSLRKKIEEAYHVRPDLGYIAHTIKLHGVEGLRHVQPELFTPVLMMKAQRLPTPEDIFEKLKTAVIEPKYDGFRLQAHMQRTHDGVRVALYSRGLDDVTYMYPDIVEGLKKDLQAETAIIEGEAIGYDEQTGDFLPFQETVQRKRKYDVEEMAKSIPLKMFVFELLYVNGESCLQVPLHQRVSMMRSIIKDAEVHQATLILSPEQEMHSAHDVHVAFDEAIAKGLEGIMVKKKDGPYQPGGRGWHWIKFKRSYSSKIEDTLDCVVMGYDAGKGKRAGFGVGAFLVGVYDADADMYRTVAKIGTGLSDEQWRYLHTECQKISTPSKPALYDVDPLVNPDVWVKPHIVVEIKADEISRSQMHTAGRSMRKTASGKAEEVDVAGYALRFPRLVRFRSDKKPTDCTTLDEVTAMFGDQIQGVRQSS